MKRAAGACFPSRPTDWIACALVINCQINISFSSQSAPFALRLPKSEGFLVFL